MKSIDLKLAYETLNTLPLVRLSAVQIGKILEKTSELKNLNTIYQKQRDGIFLSYGINPEDPNAELSYSSHPEIDKITKEITELDQSEVEVENVAIVSKEKLYECLAAASVVRAEQAQVLLSLIVGEKKD